GATARLLADTSAFGVPAGRIAIVEPGTDRPRQPSGPTALRARGQRGRAPSLLCVATLTPRKGHPVLLEALARLRDRSWTLRCVGSHARDPLHARAVAAR